MVFGGLSPCGLSLSEALMNQGIAVRSVSSALDPEEETSEGERRDLLGRNALFETMDLPDSISGDTVFIADSFRVNEEANLLLQSKIGRLMDVINLKKLRRMIILSGLEAVQSDRSGMNRKGIQGPAEGGTARIMESFIMKAAAGQHTIIFFKTKLSEMRRRGSQAAGYMAALYSADCHGVSYIVYNPDEDSEPDANRSLFTLLRQASGKTPPETN